LGANGVSKKPESCKEKTRAAPAATSSKVFVEKDFSFFCEERVSF
jgi:hypothetical protein